jgi:hypothetical protein
VIVDDYRIVFSSCYGNAFVEIQTKYSFLGIKYWDTFHRIFMDDGDAETAIRKANKMIKELENDTRKTK